MSAIVILPHEGDVVLDGFVIFKLAGHLTHGALAVVEHQLAPGILAAPPHIHHREDEISYIVEGTITVQSGEQVMDAPAGTVVFKPRGEWHTFWNQGRVPARLLEIISPAGFERYFAELHEVVAHPDPAIIDRVAALAWQYGVELDFSRVDELAQQYGVRLPASPEPGAA